MGKSFVFGIFNLTIFVLAVFVGIEVISKVPPTLHTPLMSGSNAISGITLVGAVIVASAMVGGVSGAVHCRPIGPDCPHPASSAYPHLACYESGGKWKSGSPWSADIVDKSLERIPLGMTSDVSAISSLTNLTELWLYRNEINDVSSLSLLNGLTQLSLGANQISDVSPLSSLTNLKAKPRRNS